jgi:hypothetical protein
MFLCDPTLYLVIGIQPVTDKCLDDQPGIAEVAGAILLKLRPKSGMEAVGPLLGFRLPDPF